MKRRWHSLRVTGIAISLVAFGSSARKPPAKPAPKTIVKARVVKPPSEASILAFTAGSKRLTNAERLEQAERALLSVRKVFRRVIAIETSARRDKDVVRLNCVREKLVAVKGLLRVAEQASVTLQEAVARGQGSLARYEFGRIELATSKAQQVGVEATACVGEIAVYTGPVRMVVEVDPDIPRRDPTDRPIPTPTIDVFSNIDRPQALSPPQ